MKTLKTTLSLSNMFYPISTYHGNLSFEECENEWIENNVKEGFIPDLDYYYNFCFDIKPFEKTITNNLFEKTITNNLKETIKGIPEIAKAFSKYAITLGEFKFWSPKEYNFATDSIDVEFIIKKDCRLDLKPQIIDYLQNERKESCSGYMSFEPDTIDNVELTDYAYIHAIAKKENIIEEIVACFDVVIENAYTCYYELFFEALHEWLETQPKYIKWKKEKDHAEYVEQNNLKICKLY